MTRAARSPTGPRMSASPASRVAGPATEPGPGAGQPDAKGAAPSSVDAGAGVPTLSAFLDGTRLPARPASDASSPGVAPVGSLSGEAP